MDEIHIVGEYEQYQKSADNSETNPPTWEPGDTDTQLWKLNNVKQKVKIIVFRPQNKLSILFGFISISNLTCKRKKG